MCLSKSPEAVLRVGQKVLIADTSRSSVSSLDRGLRESGWQVFACSDGRDLRRLLKLHDASLVVVELRLADGPSLKHIKWLKEVKRDVLIVVLTAHPSIATAVQCARLGACGYLEKPASADAVLAAARREALPSEIVREHPLGLNRALWEYINRAVECGGSISAGARLLGLDRRSLRRMLARYAPPAQTRGGSMLSRGTQ